METLDAWEGFIETNKKLAALGNTFFTHGTRERLRRILHGRGSCRQRIGSGFCGVLKWFPLQIPQTNSGSRWARIP